jgi:hypothetical protein
MSTGWGQRDDWSLRIVRTQGEEPLLWHIIIDEPGDEIEVTQCGDGSGAWVDLAASNVEAGDLAWLGQVCRECAAHLGWLAGVCEEDARGR